MVSRLDGDLDEPLWKAVREQAHDAALPLILPGFSGAPDIACKLARHTVAARHVPEGPFAIAASWTIVCFRPFHGDLRHFSTEPARGRPRSYTRLLRSWRGPKACNPSTYSPLRC